MYVLCIATGAGGVGGSCICDVNFLKMAAVMSLILYQCVSTSRMFKMATVLPVDL